MSSDWHIAPEGQDAIKAAMTANNHDEVRRLLEKHRVAATQEEAGDRLVALEAAIADLTISVRDLAQEVRSLISRVDSLAGS